MSGYVEGSFRDVFYSRGPRCFTSSFVDSVFYQRVFLRNLVRERDFFVSDIGLVKQLFELIDVQKCDLVSIVQLDHFLKNKEADQELSLLLDAIGELGKKLLHQFVDLSPIHSFGLRAASMSDDEQRDICIEDVRKATKDQQQILNQATHLGFLSYLDAASQACWKLTNVDRDGNTLVHLAAMNGDGLTCQFLIRKGLSYQLTNRKKRNICHLAILSGNPSLMEWMVHQGVDVYAKDNASESSLLLAARLGYRSFLESILGISRLRSDKFLKESNRFGQTLLHYGVLYPNIDLVRYLIELGFYVNAPDLGGETPLHIAVHSGEGKMCKFLLSKGADPDRRNVTGKSPLHIAVEENKTDILWQLIHASAHLNGKDLIGRTPIHLGIVAGSYESVEILLKEGADSSCVTYDKRSALHFAVEVNSRRMIEILCYGSASPFIKDILLRTPFHLACELGHWESVESFLINLPPETVDKLMQEVDSLHRTPLHAAVLGKNVSILEAIVNYTRRPSINQVDRRSVTAVSLAVLLGDKGCFDVLWKAGADFMICDNKGMSPLHKACCLNKSVMANKILESQPKTRQLRDRLGFLPIHVAAQYKSNGCLELLLSIAPEDVNERNNEGQTPLHLAAINGDSISLQILSRVNGIRTDELDRKGRTPYDLALISGAEGEMKRLFF
ncbi:ankyrin repeat domain-containing protein [Candidatus Similichlamydia epinepheli]|uniref:ankyrin repeat domain-containing protein n=1 Tax=Candidatus Similichlamydia epinepheli TaxID=1903953 RepID=UPI000D39FD5D|nr:ankyrin repeat domain-containing protein [Candidatus Similichlamydia epinepheli]